MPELNEKLLTEESARGIGESMKSCRFWTLSITILLILTGLLVAQTSVHPFSVQDMVMLDRISDARISPDGKKAVFVVRSTDMDANTGRKDIWMVNTNGSLLQRLTADPANDSDPHWAADGNSVWFLSSRTGLNQVWQYSMEKRTETQVTDYPLEVSHLLPTPDGKYLIISMEVFPGLSVQQTGVRLQETKNRKASGIIYDRLFIRHWDQWKDGRRRHLFVIPVSGGKPLDLMAEMDADCPSKPFGDMKEVTFTPDKTGLIFTAREAGRQEAWSTNFDLFHVPLDASQSPRNLTAPNLAWDQNPVFSPDGKILAYLAMKNPQSESDRRRIILRTWPYGPERVLAKDWDRSPSEFFWSKDSKTIFAIADNLGQVPLFRIDLRTEQVKSLIDRGRVRSPSLAGQTILFGLDHLKSSVELYTCDLQGKNLMQITRINDSRLNSVKMGDYEQFKFQGWNGETVYGYLVKPVNFDPQKKYPVAFLIHGGPHGSFGNDFHYRWNPQTYAGAGYAAVMIDFHGSAGYGHAFQDAIRKDWGGKPLVDLQKGLETALNKYPFLDGNRVGALGASYGGYMINWIAGNWPDRFRCLVNHDGNLDERMAYFDTEELWFPEWEHGGTPWENPSGYEEQNPVNFIKNWKTPMLVIHGEMDYRVVVTQAIGTFNALQRRGIPSKFLYFPDENHWVLKPHNSILWHETVIGWLDQWLKTEK